MRLEYRPNGPESHLHGCRERHREFRRMMGKIIRHRDIVEFTQNLKTTMHARKACSPLAMSCGAIPHTWAVAAAAKAFRTLCRPGTDK